MAKYQGGGFLIISTPPAAVFTPEDLSDFHRQMGETVRQFVEREVQPAVPAMEEHDFSHNVRLLRQAGELGLLGVEIPEEFGGLGLDKVTAMVVNENLAGASSFSVSLGGHIGIGTLPIVFFGNRTQKEKYLPKLATAELVSAYALTEAGSGSDAMSIKTSARLSPDGRHWILNGTKQWITNAGFADMFIVYAKVDGDKFSAFIVEKAYPGVRVGKEEHKMGIRGSSTCEVILEDALVPVENLLHEIGKGHHIAFNILNLGRYKIGAGAVGAAKLTLGISAKYAAERQQFGQPIARFGLIQNKLAEMAIRTYAIESVAYRTAGLLDEGLASVDHGAENAGQESTRAISEYAVECSINKVLGSEVMGYTVDEAVQIHGGYGFMEEYPVCRAYRDSRIFRIFEGTNEINRMLIPGDMLRKAMKGQLALLPALMQLQTELMTITPPLLTGEAPLEQEMWLLEAAKKITLMVAGLGVQKYQQAVEKEQEFLAGVADLCIDTFAMESCLLRALKHPSDPRTDMAVAFTHDAFARIGETARVLLASIEEGDTLRTQLAILRKLTRRDAINSIALKRRIAARVIEAGGYVVA